MLLWKKRWITHFLGHVIHLFKPKGEAEKKTEGQRSQRDTKEEALDVCSHQAQPRTSQLIHLPCVYSLGQKQLSPISQIPERHRARELHWVRQHSSREQQWDFWQLKCFLKATAFWLPPSGKWLLLRMTTSETMQNPVLQRHKSHLNSSDLSLFCTLFQRTSEGWQFCTSCMPPLVWGYVYDRIQSWVPREVPNSASRNKTQLSNGAGEGNGCWSETDTDNHVTFSASSCVLNLWASVSSFIKSLACQIKDRAHRKCLVWFMALWGNRH